MDHAEAIRLQAAVKYALGELPEQLRDEYEEHYFDCAVCAGDVRATAAFLDNAREALRALDRKESPSKVAAPAQPGWFAWFRPAFALPAFAALLVIILYQNTVEIPRARQESASGAAQLFVSSRAPKMAVTRGGEEVKLAVRPNESLPLRFDFTPTPTLDAYICRLQDESGHTVLQLRVPGSFTNKELNLVIPSDRVKPGKYTLVFTGDPAAKRQPTKGEVLRLAFVVEFLS